MTPLTGPILTAAEMRAAEAAAIAAGISVDRLMERAGHALAEAVWRFGGGRPALVLCGPGNNGGDGYVAARLLRDKGLEVRLAALAPPATDVAQRAAQGWQGLVEPLAEAAPAPVLLDCLFGTGLTRPLADAIATKCASLRAEAGMVIAADVPSGVGTDDGRALGAMPANVTIALGALKPAHLLQPAAHLCGHIVCADIGIMADSHCHVAGRPHLPPPGPDDHKYTRGLVAVVAGQMAGAAGLCAAAAARAGAGYVMLAEGQAAGMPLSIVHRPLDEVLADRRVSALIIGPGLGRDDGARRKLAAVLDVDCPLLLDADALHLIDLAQLRRRTAPTLLTPHKGEFAALFGDAGGGSKLDRARHAAAQSGATIIFKGADSVVAAPDGRALLSAGSPAWLASAGTGDVLAGIAGAMLARGQDALTAAEAALWLHKRAAALAGPALIADDVLLALPTAFAESTR